MAEDVISLLNQVAFIQPKRGGIPIAVSIPQIEPDVWQASAEIACSHPGVMWTGPRRAAAADAHADRVAYIEDRLSEDGGSTAGGNLSYAPVDDLPEPWVNASVSRLMKL